MREPICGVDYKACKGCGDDCDMEQFIVKNYETAYCPECRTECRICGDWVGECGGEHGEAERSAAA